MNQISKHGFRSLAALAIIAAMSAFARSDDSPEPAATVLAKLQATAPSSTAAGQGAAAPVTPAPDSVRATQSTPDNGTDLSRDESAASVSSSYVPNMIGDMGGGPTFQIIFPKGETTRGPGTLQVPSPSASILGSQRLADNDCTLPTDRVFFDYSYFHDAQLAAPTDANRFVPGFEKTFFDGRMSVEMRIPLGSLESNDIVIDNPVFGTTGQFGDLQVIVKALLHRDDRWALGIGMGVSVPTAPDVNVGFASGAQFMKIANTSTHLLPYAAFLATPNDNWFVQGDVQVDIAASGDAVSGQSLIGNGRGLISAGDIYDQTLLFADATVGRWLYRDPSQRFSGFAAVLEAHYTGGLNAPSTLQVSGVGLGYVTPRYNELDLTVGAHVVYGLTTVTAGFVTPVTDDRGFDGELRLFVNRMF